MAYALPSCGDVRGSSMAYGLDFLITPTCDFQVFDFTYPRLESNYESFRENPF